jgi:signal transduction histidine kinase
MLFQALEHSPYCQKLDDQKLSDQRLGDQRLGDQKRDQPKIIEVENRAYWKRAIAILAQLLPQNPGGILLTHSPQLFDFSELAINQIWLFTASQSSLINLPGLPQFSLEIVHLAKPEFFLVYLSPHFQILLISEAQSLIFSCHHQPLAQIIALLKSFISQPSQLNSARFFAQPDCDYHSLSQFSALLFELPVDSELQIPEITEANILRSLSHEISTPLSTISTLTKSLLRRQDLIAQVRYRLEQIELECRNQIDRFRLIFEALDLGRSPLLISEIETDKLLQELLPHWLEKLDRQQLKLELILPNHIPPNTAPKISSNEQLLKLLLNGITDRLSRVLPPNSHIQIETAIVGEHWKLQFQIQIAEQLPPIQNLGQWLMLQPETGRISLSLSITKTLFRSLRGKLTVKSHPISKIDHIAINSEILTIFLPLV